MNRIDKTDVRHVDGQLPNGAEHIHERFTEIFTSVGRNEDHAFRQTRQAGKGCPLIEGGHCHEGIYDGISCDENLLFRDSRIQQILPGFFRRGEGIVRHLVCEPPVDLFREWLVFIVGPEPGLHMADGDAMIKSGKRSRKNGCCVPLGPE